LFRLRALIIAVVVSTLFWGFGDLLVFADIQVRSAVHAIAVNSNTEKLYFAHDNGSVSVVDAQTRDVLSQIQLPGTDDEDMDYFQSSIGINEKTNKIYASSGSGDLSVVIDGSTNEIVEEILLDQHMDVMNIAVNPVTNRIYAATYSFIYVIDGSNDEIIDRIDIGDHTYMSGDVGSLWPAELSINPDTNTIYATNAGNDLIAVIDGSANRIVANITVPTPFSAVINPMSNKLYVTFESSDNMVVYNGAHPYERLSIIENVETQSFSNDHIAIDAQRNRVYVVTYPEDGFTVIDGNSDKMVEKIATDFRPMVLGVNPVTGTVYVGMDSYHLVEEIQIQENASAATPHPPVIQDNQGMSLDTANLPLGAQLTLSQSFHNNGNVPQEYVILIEIRDSTGVSTHIAWQGGIAGIGQEKTIGISWIPPYVGDHQIRTFVISNLTNPEVLSNVETINVIVVNSG
jgi:YVTN family beta-propeller protein